MYQWLKNKLSQLLVMSNKSHNSTLHQGEKNKKLDIENVIGELILMNWSLGVSISSWEVIIKACNLNTELKQKKIGTLKKWCYNFLKIHLLTFDEGIDVHQIFLDFF